MTRKTLIWLLATFLLTTATAADAQPTGKVFRIGFLDNGTASGMAVLVDELRQELIKLGLVEGKTERLHELAADLVRLKVDLIVTTGDPAGLAAKGATSTIPIVMANAGDPVGFGLVASLAR